ncbi:hypothetical protein FB451DRAFT_1406554 [Mycena latifolia]|nr:hypothetical protein FB451DRAFT_1406554 [Mycena latifolia]
MSDWDLIVPETFYSSPKTPTVPKKTAKKAPKKAIPSAESTPAHPPANPPSTQPKLRKKKRDNWQKADDILATITKDFRSLGAFLEVVFYNRISGVPDPRTPRHARAAAAFLGGESNVTMGTIINLIYNHRQSRAPKGSGQYLLDFSPPDVASPRDIDYARPSLSTWALQIVDLELRRQVGRLTQNDPADPTDTTQLRASTNGRAKKVRLATWDTLGRVSIPFIATTYKRRSRAVWYATECMGTSWGNQFIDALPKPLRQRLPCTSTGSMAICLQNHVDEKRIFSRFGFTVHDSTARACLDSLTDSSLAKLRESVAEGIANGTMYWQIVLDNVQQYCRQRDHRLGRQDVLKVGTAATAILLEDCAPGAFNLQDHLDRVMKQERRELTIDSLYGDIDMGYIHELTALHWVRILVHFIPQLAYLRREVAAALNSERMTKHRLPKGRINVVQPLGTNAEKSTETQGMMRALLDSWAQMGLDEKALEGLIFMARGDGASFAAMMGIKKYLSAHPAHYKAFRNLVPPGPEIWHARWTQLNAISSNSYGPATGTDPSCLSKSATAAGAKRPSNLKKVDFFPTSRSMMLFFEARVLDCWRIWFKAEDIIEYFAKPMQNPPDLHGLWAAARKLVKRYASQQAYTNALSKEFSDSAHVDMKVPSGTTWIAPVARQTEQEETVGEPEEDEADPVIVDEPGEEEQVVSDSEEGGKKRKKKKKRPTVHVEADGFTGDRVLANEVLFLQDMGWWIIAAHAVPDGEIGRVWEIMKLWIMSFSGSGNHNYTNYLLETYCLHRYEASKDFSDAMLNNWLISTTGHKYVELDWSQEYFNKWLEEMVEHKGGDFDDRFYRHTLAPNVNHFLRIKQMETAFELKPRSKTHGAPHLRNEFQNLLRMHREDELHLFRPGRTMGHASLNFFERGYEKLEDNRIAKFIQESTAYSDITKDVLNGEEHDDWDEEKQKKFDAMLLQDPEQDSDEESESERESEDGDDAGDIGVHGILYSDEESDDEDAESLGLGGQDSEDNLEGDEENEELSEIEEEQMDNYVNPGDDLGSEDED